MLEEAKALIQHEEGFRKSVYKDSRGYWTLGWGFLVDARLDAGIPEDVAEIWLDLEVERVVDRLEEEIPWWTDLPQAWRVQLISMAYQLGVRGLLGFARMLEALRDGDGKIAAQEVLDSRWARQTLGRAKRVAQAFLTTGT